MGSNRLNPVMWTMIAWLGACAAEPAIPTDPPPGYVVTDIGGYRIGPQLADGGAPIEPDDPAAASDASVPDPEGCAILVGVVRDFRGALEQGGHPDFDAFGAGGPTPGLVARELGADGKPVYASRCESQPDASSCPYGQQTTSKADFDAWYRTVPGVNEPHALYLAFVAHDGSYSFGSGSFFPLDGDGFGDSDPATGHNFSFTTELHARFRYDGGEHFTFSGDDDLWVFIDGKLAIDLGGLHASTSAELDLDDQAAALGLTLGETYALDLFHAERARSSSNFRVDTTLKLTDCGR